jgi:hypothetical protein
MTDELSNNKNETSCKYVLESSFPTRSLTQEHATNKMTEAVTISIVFGRCLVLKSSRKRDNSVSEALCTNSDTASPRPLPLHIIRNLLLTNPPSIVWEIYFMRMNLLHLHDLQPSTKQGKGNESEDANFGEFR